MLQKDGNVFLFCQNRLVSLAANMGQFNQSPIVIRMFFSFLFLPVRAVSSLQKLEERFRISRRELISFEFTILVALEMALYLPESKVLPHYRRLVQQQQV